MNKKIRFIKEKAKNILISTLLSFTVLSFVNVDVNHIIDNNISGDNSFSFINSISNSGIAYAKKKHSDTVDRSSILPNETPDEWVLRQGDNPGYEDSKYLSFYSDPLVNKIVQQLVITNPDKLNFNDGKHKKYINSVKVVKTVNKTDWNQANAFNITNVSNNEQISSNIYITDSYIDEAVEFNGRLYRIYGEQKERMAYKVWHPVLIGTNNDDDIYVRSDIASCLAHELGHHYDIVILNGQHNKKGTSSEEDFADEMSMLLLDGSPQYSYGSNVTTNTWDIINAFGADRDLILNAKSSDHSTQPARIFKAIDFIQNTSKGRIKIDYNENSKRRGFFTLDDVNVKVPEYRYFDEYVPGFDRAYYASGQIAWAIKYDLWHQKNIKLIPIKTVFPDSKDEGSLLIINNPNYNPNNPSIAPFKIIDKFENSVKDIMKRVKEIHDKNGKIPESEYHDYSYWGAYHPDYIDYKDSKYDIVQIEEAMYLIWLYYSASLN